MRTYIVAAFAEGPFKGNPAGVCLLQEALGDDALQRIARDLAQPETAFVRQVDGGWAIRWFSPLTEVALCGHATLAAAHVLWREGLAPADRPIDFAAGETALCAMRESEDLIWLDFPALPGREAAPPDDLLACVSPAPVATMRHADRWLFEYVTAAEVRAARPDFGALARTGVRSLILTAPSDRAGYDIISRNFAPIVGVDEDQVTGVAHTCLAPHWQPRLGFELRCWQASQRGGVVLTRLRGDRVHLGGRAVLQRRTA